MKKVVTYFFILGAFLLLTRQAFSFETNQLVLLNQINTENVDLVVKKQPVQFSSDVTTFLYNYDNEDSEDFHIPFDKKNELNFSLPISFNSNVKDYISQKSFNNAYYFNNFSRLPRLTYIFLKVLRL